MTKAKTRKLFEEWVKNKSDNQYMILDRSKYGYESGYEDYSTHYAFIAFCAAIEYMEEIYAGS